MGIAFEKPGDFEPTFTASVLNNRQFLSMCYVMLLVFILGVPYATYQQDYFLVFSSLVGFSFFLLFLIFLRRLAKNPNIVELSEKGIWLPIYGVFIPSDCFVRVVHSQGSLNNGLVRARMQRIKIVFSSTKPERRLLLRKLITYSKWKDITPTTSHTAILIPFTTGTLENIGLNVTKSELIDAFDILKSS